MKKTVLLVLMLIPLISMAQKPGYYNGIEGKSGEELKTALHNIINQHVDFSYSDAKYILNYADSDPANENNVILFYTKRSQSNDSWGTGSNDINREHVWAKSHGNFVDVRPMDGDAFNLHPTDASTNIAKSNYDFDECSDIGTYIAEADAYYSSSQDKFEPQDATKGEVARTIFYMSVRYEGTDGELDLEAVDAVNTYPAPTHGKLSTLLQWNRDFPPTDLERRRNERVFEAQNNRNPFIDNPDLADMIWNDKAAPTILIGELNLENNYPLANTTTLFSANITGNTEATLYYGLAWDSESNNASMTQSGSVWSADFNLTGFAPGDLVHYKIVAGDGLISETVRGSYPISEIKSLTEISAVQGTGTSTPMLNSSVTIGGIVTANFDNTYYLQNGTDTRSGMCVYGIRRANIGDSIVVTGNVTEYNNLTELEDVTYTYVYKKGEKIVPPEITIDQAKEDYEGMLVKIRNVTFLEGDTFIPVGNSTTLNFTDGSSSMTVYSRYNSRLGGNVVPSGTVDVTGVVSQYMDTYQLLINSIDDIVAGDDSEAPLITGVIVNDASWIEVSFNEKLDKSTAEVVSNYSITDGVIVEGAYLYNDTKVLLMVSGLLEQDYTLTVSNVSDLQGNTISQTSVDFHSNYSSLGISNFKNEDFLLFPNPTSDHLNIKITRDINPDFIRILDIQGRKVYEKKINNYSNQFSLDLNYITEGIYILQLKSDSKIIQDIFSIQK